MIRHTRLLTFSLAAVLSALVGTGETAAAVSVLSSLVQPQALQPGEVGRGQIVVRNTGERAQAVRVYPAEYRFWADGRTDYRVAHGRSNRTWITYAPREFEIPAGEITIVAYEVQVPQSETLAGTYWSMLMVEPQTAVASDGRDAPPALKVQTVVRYGVQVVTHIGDSGSTELEFAEKRLVSAGERRLLQLEVRDPGERGLRLHLWADVYDAEGQRLGRFDGGPLRLYPGCSALGRIDVSRLGRGRYNALLVADTGDDHVFGATLQFEVP